ncbi:conserved membrane protein of unknown function [Nitrosotalea devaniterrae]|uniref:Uncharacterized protein n=1 Tax=Nitrosotalea devaniterrae TaxID=1078905 RepID=A0A128A4A4_9ARCH|nr:conserved membrane protein of unknown function [Candidatus Nitrosotalea devanaterra]
MHKEAFQAVYLKKRYIILSVAIFLALFVLLSFVSEFIFLSPVFVFYVPQYAIVDFVLIVAISSLSGIVSSFSIYRIRITNNGIKKSGASFLGPAIGASAGACSCGSLGFSAISIFGTIGGTATAFLTNYETPLRLVSIAILCYTYYASVKDITVKCKISK